MSEKSDPDLWGRIESYSLDQSGINLPFSARLARENGWSREFAQRVVEEYKKFVYLMCVSGEMLTPSQEVDEAWHLHLVYTRDYWVDFCRGLLGKDIHHEPTEGGDSECAKFRNCYRRTKERYHEEFGTMPPSDIWPDEQTRFGEATGDMVVETSRSPYITKSQLGTAAAFFAFFVLWAGWSHAWNSAAWTLIVGMAAFFALTRLLPIGRPRRNRQKGNGGGCGGGAGCGSGCGGGGCGGGGD